MKKSQLLILLMSFEQTVVSLSSYGNPTSPASPFLARRFPPAFLMDSVRIVKDSHGESTNPYHASIYPHVQT